MTKKKNDLFILWFSIFIIIVIAGIYMLSTKENPDQDNIDSFASCISDTGAKFYGAFWCSHCEAQKELFGRSKNLPYIECSTADGQGQLDVCKQAGIKGYPTWVFADGQEKSGKLSFKQLSQFTNCELLE